jgi:hypothetical protein
MNGKISNFQQIGSLRRYTLEGGKEKGIDVIDCDNGKLRFLLNVSKACDVMQLYHEGQNTSFISKNGFTLREPPFGNRFEGGMLYTCGLDNVGGMRDGNPVHGSLHNIPAEIVRAECNDEGIVVEAIIRDTALFGKNLVLRRRIYSAIGSDSLRLEDTLVNEGYRTENYCVLYHVNFGYPLLDEGARIVADVAKCDPRTDWARENVATVCEITEPLPEQKETCYFLTFNQPRISLINDKLGKSVTLSYSGDTLPHFVEWKSMACGTYALGFEPTTTELDDRFAYKTLDAGESVRFWIELDLKRDAAE